MKLIFTIAFMGFAVICLTSCATRNDVPKLISESSQLDKKCNNLNAVVTGIAIETPDHSGKMMRNGVAISGANLIFRGDYLGFTPEIYGKRIRVFGRIQLLHWPMFIEDQSTIYTQGISVPPGTDIESKSRYYAIENPLWEIIH